MADNNKNGLLLAGAALISAAAFIMFKSKGVMKLTLATPSTAKQGATVDVTLEGIGLTDVTTVVFGEGVVVNSFDVDSDTQITANITIAGTAVAGVRNISVSTETGTATLKGGFTVLTVGALQVSNLTATFW
jgi:hypothetical protein